MLFIDKVKYAFDLFISVLCILLLLSFLTYLPNRFFGGDNPSCRKKRWTMRSVAILIIAIIIYVCPLAPKKDLVIVTRQPPKLNGSEGTSPAYFVYYVWDGEQEKHPWWVIFQAPIEEGGFEWAVLEVADVGNVYDTNNLTSAMASASKFDKNWLKREMHRVQRTRLEKFRHIAFGVDNLENEERVIKKVMEYIESEENKKR